MPSLKEYTVKLARLRSTRKMTKTMKMVSATKLRRAQESQKQADRYAERMQDWRCQISSHLESVPG